MSRQAWADPASGAALGESRAHVLQLLRAARGPLGVQEVAEPIGLHPNTVRFHLDGLVESGLAERETEDRDQPGRPRVVYRPSAAADGAPGGPSYRLLAGILASLVDAMLPEPSEAAAEAGRAWGRYLTEPPTPLRPVGAADAARRLVDVLSGMGFVSETAPGPSGPLLRLLRCPFREVAEDNQAVVCSLHLGLMQGALTEMRAPLAADRLEPFVEPGLCVGHLRRRQAGPAGLTAANGGATRPVGQPGPARDGGRTPG